MNKRVISYVLGWVVCIEALCMLLPLVCSLYFRDSYAWAFALSALFCLIVGIPLVLTGPKNRGMFAKEGFVIVGLSWLVISIFGTIPFMLTGAIPNFIDALFETASGFTTTGASILTDVEALPKSVLFWRSFTHWIGGMGVIVFLVALLPLSGGNNLHLLKAESPGYSVGKLVPKVKATAKILYEIYLVMTVLLIVLLKIGGLSLFDSACLAFGTAGTGGFAIKNSGLSEYSAYIQTVITVFMIMFGIDFSFYYLLLMKKIKQAFKLEEVLVYICIVFLSAIIIFFNIRSMYPTDAEAVRHSFFQVGTVITTTGYATTDFNLWPELSKTLLVALMFCGACAGSTGGGMKVSRIMILVKSIVNEVKVITHPKSVKKVKMNKRILDADTLRGVYMYFAAYALLYVAGMLILSLNNKDFITNFTAMVATMSNIGPGLSLVGPYGNYAVFSGLSKVVLTIAMITGRLEIFPMLVLASVKTWKK